MFQILLLKMPLSEKESERTLKNKSIINVTMQPWIFITPRDDEMIADSESIELTITEKDGKPFIEIIKPAKTL